MDLVAIGALAVRLEQLRRQIEVDRRRVHDGHLGGGALREAESELETLAGALRAAIPDA